MVGINTDTGTRAQMKEAALRFQLAQCTLQSKGNTPNVVELMLGDVPTKHGVEQADALSPVVCEPNKLKDRSVLDPA